MCLKQNDFFEVFSHNLTVLWWVDWGGGNFRWTLGLGDCLEGVWRHGPTAAATPPRRPAPSPSGVWRGAPTVGAGKRRGADCIAWTCMPGGPRQVVMLQLRLGEP